MTEAPFAIIQRPRLFGRALHDQNPAKGGTRERFGGTLTPWRVRKGYVVAATKAGRTVRGYVSGYTNTTKTRAISVANARWCRLGQFVVSKVRLLGRSTRLLVEAVSMARA